MYINPIGRSRSGRVLLGLCQEVTGGLARSGLGKRIPVTALGHLTHKYNYSSNSGNAEAELAARFKKATQGSGKGSPQLGSSKSGGLFLLVSTHTTYRVFVLGTMYVLCVSAK